jgi:hypothetical protein
MKIFYVENEIQENRIEQIYLIDTEGFGVFEFSSEMDENQWHNTPKYESIKEFKSLWRGRFDQCCVMLQVY